ncbi:MAG: glycosyltransferase family 39 protein, partial [Chloroflexia bacterium]|nr:glycosyltransferase family 39 protein [Chloroflexia bacterium]
MAGEMPIDREKQWRAAPAQDSVLDRRISLTLTTGRWIAIVAAIVIAGLLRLPGLDRWAFSAAEAETALAARDLILGNDIPNNLLGRPFAVEWTGLFMFLGDSVDSVARMSVAVAGLAIVVLTLRLGRWMSTAAAAAAAILIALSPTMVATSRRIDGGALLVALTLAVIGCVLVSGERRSELWPILAGISAALLVLSG